MVCMQKINFPVAKPVADSPIFYGWVVWGVATLGLIATAPAQNFTVALFVDALIQDFGLDRTTISTLFSLGTILSALSLTWVGRKIDRHGNRLAGVIISGLFAVSLTLFALVTSPIALLGVFILVRGLGQGSLWLVNSTAISQWFIRRRGFMMSLTLVIFALFQTIYVPQLQRILEVHDWRMVWVILGVIVGVFTVPITWALMRNKPEDFGLLPDGLRHETIHAHPTLEMTPIAEDNWTLREAQKTIVFWLFVIGRMVSPAVGGGLVFHQVSIFATQGFTARHAAEAFALLSIVSAVVSFVGGMIVQRLKPGQMMAWQQIGLITVLIGAANLSTPWGMPLYVIGFGTLVGNAGIFDGAVWTNLFGRLHQGAIRGFVITTTIIGTALGPVVLGVSFDLLGSYAPALLFFALLGWLIFALSLLIPLPKH